MVIHATLTVTVQPENVFLTPGPPGSVDSIRVGDFGLCLQMRRLRADGPNARSISDVGSLPKKTIYQHSGVEPLRPSSDASTMADMTQTLPVTRGTPDYMAPE